MNKDLLKNERENIKDIDKKMAVLFEERMKSVLEIAKIKKANDILIYDKAYEEKLLNENLKNIKNENIKKYYINFLNKIFDISKQIQNEYIC